MKFLYSKRPGASLLEQLMVLGIILFIVALTIPRIRDFMGKISEDKTKIIMSRVHSAISLYANDVGHAPTNEEGGLDALLKRPKGENSSNWNGPYLVGEKTIPNDSYGNKFMYSSPPRKFKGIYKKFELYSFGKDEDSDASNRLRVGD